MAFDVASARRALDTEHPGAVVADLEPGGARDEWQLIEAIKRDPVTRQVPVVLLTVRIDPVIQSHG